MKNKVIYILVMMIILGLIFKAQGLDIKRKRYHQHLKAQINQEDTLHDDKVFHTHLPLMSITTDEPMPEPYLMDDKAQPIYNEYEQKQKNNATVAATVRYYDSPNTYNHLTDTPTIESKALTRIRGTSSRLYDKKGYAIEFKKDNLVDNKNIALSGMTPDSDWVLNGPFLDKSLIRNYLGYNLSGEIMDYAPNVRFCELFLNDEYMGVYLLIEEVKYNKDGRINLTKSNPKMMATSYILEIDRGAEDEAKRLNPFGARAHLTTKQGGMDGQFKVVYPSKTLTKEQSKYIETELSRFEKSLTSFDYNDPKKGYKNYIDVQDFVDYFIINEFTLNYDAMGLSTYVYKDVRGKIKLCVWDFNSAFDYYPKPSAQPQRFETQSKLWYKYLFRDQEFVDAVIRRYRELRKTVLSDKYLISYIDETIDYLGEAIDRNNEKWGYAYEKGIQEVILRPVERNPKNYDEAIKDLKTTIIQRGKYMDEHIESLNRLSHDSLNKKYNHRREGE